VANVLPLTPYDGNRLNIPFAVCLPVKPPPHRALLRVTSEKKQSVAEGRSYVCEWLITCMRAKERQKRVITACVQKRKTGTGNHLHACKTSKKKKLMSPSCLKIKRIYKSQTEYQN
jgi:hypothetical protein